MREAGQLDPFDDLDVLADQYARARSGADRRAGRRLRDDFVRDALPFAGRLARRYRGRGEPADDLEQVARLGLVKTIDRYDPERGSFTAYAILTITGEIKRHFRDHTWGVHVPRGQQDRVLEFVQARAVLTAELCRTPTVAELAARLGLEEAEVLGAQASAAAHSTESLNAPLGDHPNGAEVGDLFGAEDGELTLVDDRTTVENLLCELPARERRLLALRFWGNRSQVEIAEELGISQMHVSRLLSRTLSWLREAMLSDVTPPWTASGPPDHRVLVTAGADGVRAAVHGEIDRDNANQIRRELLSAAGSCGSGRTLVVDLSRVPLLSAAGIAMLNAVHEVARARLLTFRLTGVQPYVARVLVIAGLRNLLAE
ncbi:sigma-70 family RNA polymerase sigma factor [Actinoplanes sp. HUAS TT8]|uniref:sigma-70 family RNA polymerase sigma factor n=1 Tax=Actinoplanes sp. HUAS TT8 TaxID=3447453 RepID=UPI003F51E053